MLVIIFGTWQGTVDILILIFHLSFSSNIFSILIYSFYLSWILGSVHLKKDDPILSKNMTLRVNGTGFILHAYVNGEYVGKTYKYGFLINLKYTNKFVV